MGECETVDCSGRAVGDSPFSPFRGLCEDCIARIFEERTLGHLDHEP